MSACSVGGCSPRYVLPRDWGVWTGRAPPTWVVLCGRSDAGTGPPRTPLGTPSPPRCTGLTRPGLTRRFRQLRRLGLVAADCGDERLVRGTRHGARSTLDGAQRRGEEAAVFRDPTQPVLVPGAPTRLGALASGRLWERRDRICAVLVTAAHTYVEPLRHRPRYRCSDDEQQLDQGETAAASCSCRGPVINAEGMISPKISTQQTEMMMESLSLTSSARKIGSASLAAALQSSNATSR